MTQTCSPSALVLGASEAGPGLFVVWPVQGPAKSGKRPVQGSVPSGTRPFGRSATTTCDCSGLHLTPCFLRVRLLGSNRSALSGGTFSARVPLARPQRLGPLWLRHPWIGPLGSNPSSSRRPRSPAELDCCVSAGVHLVGLIGVQPPLDTLRWLFGCSGAPLFQRVGHSCVRPLGSAAPP